MLPLKARNKNVICFLKCMDGCYEKYMELIDEPEDDRILKEIFIDPIIYDDFSHFCMPELVKDEAEDYVTLKKTLDVFTDDGDYIFYPNAEVKLTKDKLLVKDPRILEYPRASKEDSFAFKLECVKMIRLYENRLKTYRLEDVLIHLLKRD